MACERLSIGIISDTHGLLRPQALAALTGSDHILHAGDIGDPRILDALRGIAPVTAVRGNNDRDAAFEAVPEIQRITLGGIDILLLHDLKTFDRSSEPPAVLVCGHSHRPRVETVDGILEVNPGSAGPRRFSLPVSLARLVIVNAAVERAEWFALEADEG